ncbi:hypothetical protein SAMN04487959_12923 [Modicisalibacter xianhensis]|uniref:Transposase n=2 Tax=Modicisalibacter xianhensis TaxID=442341 RepID=A0A1I3GBS2_9GAMM|nr:hypothetical protein SAMN04487959_12923 [Halomonas xianhensis]
MRELYLAGLEENRALRQEVRELKEVMLRLPAPAQAEPSETALGATKAPSPADDDPHGFRAMVRALREPGQ